MYSFVFLFMLVQSVYGQVPTALGTAPGCLPYGANCTSGNSCCYYPSILCLPDVKNGTSCLSTLDLINLSPSLTGGSIIGPLLSSLGNSTSGIGVVQEVVKVNGTTVYNQTQTITPIPVTPVNGTMG